MQRALTVTGVLGAGTALVFAAAALASALFPNGALMPANGWGGNVVMLDRAGPMPAVRLDAPDIVVKADDAGGWTDQAPSSIESPAPVPAPVLAPSAAPVVSR